MRISGLVGDTAIMDRRSSTERYETGLPTDEVVCEREPRPGRLGTE
jgi:hypothetical protein